MKPEGTHFPKLGNDGDYGTRWCANGEGVPQSWQVDLGEAMEITGVRITWEFDNRYWYTLEGSADGKEWKPLADVSKEGMQGEVQEHKFAAAPSFRHVRITINKLSPGAWASFYEFEVLGKEMVERVIGGGSAASGASGGVRGGKNWLAGVKVPAGFELSLYAAPPEVNYPTCLACGQRGEVYIGVDQNGSLDAKPGRGKVLRCLDTDGDGQADEIKTFATMDSPRGVICVDRTLYVLHPPFLTAYHDDNGDGVSDREERLVDGIGFDLKFRGADHTTNGIRLGIDGWIYIAVGDYGFVKATGKDGTTKQLYGGGVARVRTDGSGLEIVSRGQRNIYDVAIDPYMNLFTRDNTNDGGGWDVRLSHVVPSGHYGYPSLFKNFADEIIQPLAIYGGGSPCGSLFIDEPSLPRPYHNGLYTVEWGRNAIFRHPLEPNGATFKAGQETFIDIARPTDMDISPTGCIYVSSWKDGNFNFAGPNVGFVALVRPEGRAEGNDFLDRLKKQTPAELVKYVGAPSAILRMTAQRELLSRPAAERAEMADLVAQLAAGDGPLAGRVAAVYTLAQMQGGKAMPAVLKLAEKPELTEHAIRALADDVRLAKEVPVDTLVSLAAGPNVRVQAAEAWALGRLPMTEKSGYSLFTSMYSADPIVAHVAMRSLIAQRVWKLTLAELRAAMKPRLLWGVVLGEIHEPALVDALIELVNLPPGELGRANRDIALTALCRLYYREHDWDGKWWGTRPDTTGPYFKGVRWEQTDKIDAALKSALAKSDAATVRHLLTEMKRHKIENADAEQIILKLAASDESFRPTAAELLADAPQISAAPLPVLLAVAQQADSPAAARLAALKGLSKAAGNDDGLTVAVTSFAAVKPGGDDLGKLRDEFARDGRFANRAAKLLELARTGDPAVKLLAWRMLMEIDSNARLPEAKRLPARKAIEAGWSDPKQLPPMLRAAGEAKAEQYALQINLHRKGAGPFDPYIAEAANYAAKELDLDSQAADPNRVAIATLAYDQVQAEAQAEKGDAKLGARLFVRQGCVACHTASASETPKGPFLGGISARYKRPELIESIVKPSAKIAQGFETQFFNLADGRTLDGFVTREAGDEVEIRNTAGIVAILAKAQIEERGKREVSMMPTGLVEKLTTKELAAILAYLESLPSK